jgi:Leu/Phe-tRNA-protein transferase
MTDASHLVIKNYKILHNLIQTPHMKLMGSLHVIRFALYEDTLDACFLCVRMLIC